MASKPIAILLGVVVLTLCLPLASTFTDLLQDFCVANFAEKVYVNGYPCKDPKMVEANDFFMSGFEKAGNTTNPMGSKVTPASVKQIPGLNTVGLSMVRIDLAPYGVNPPHTHPRATEMITVIEGTMEVGFITSAPEYRLITKLLQQGDVFVFPMGLIHFQRNNGSQKAVAIGAQSSQNAGVVSIPTSLFNSTPEIPTDLLGRVLQVDYNIIAQLKKKGAAARGPGVQNEVVESVTISVISELIIGGREFLEALSSYAGEVAGELRIIGQNHRPSSDKAIDQRLLVGNMSNGIQTYTSYCKSCFLNLIGQLKIIQLN